MPTFVVADGRVGADETFLVDAGLHIDACAARCGEFVHEVQNPQGRGEAIAYSRFASTRKRVRLADAIGNAGGL